MSVEVESAFVLPDIGEGLAEAEIVQWLVAVGDVVALDQAVVVVETAKAQVELPIPYGGTVTTINAREGESVEVGSALMVIRHADPDGATDPVPLPVSGADVHAEHRGGAEGPRDQPVRSARRVLASPSTRRLARTRGIAIDTVVGTGPGGRVLRSDVMAFTGVAAIATTTPPSRHAAVGSASGGGSSVEPAGDRMIPLRGLRKQIAKSMTEAWSVPHVTEFREIDATGLIEAHRLLRPGFAEQGRRLTFLPLFVLACARALQRHPRFNASLDLEHDLIVEHGSVNIGIATSSPDGLLVPVLKNVARSGLSEIAERLDELTSAAKERSIDVADLVGGTFTITNFGSFGTWLGTPVIRPPEAAIAGFGRIADRVVAVDGQAVVRKILPIVVAGDHRLNDGADLSAFLDDIARYCGNPILLLEGC